MNIHLYWIIQSEWHLIFNRKSVDFESIFCLMDNVHWTLKFRYSYLEPNQQEKRWNIFFFSSIQINSKKGLNIRSQIKLTEWTFIQKFRSYKKNEKKNVTKAKQKKTILWYITCRKANFIDIHLLFAGIKIAIEDSFYDT